MQSLEIRSLYHEELCTVTKTNMEFQPFEDLMLSHLWNSTVIKVFDVYLSKWKEKEKKNECQC